MRQEQRSKKEVIMSQKQRYKDHPAGFAPVLDCSKTTKQRGGFYLSRHQFFFLDQTLNLAYAETWFGHFVSKCNWCRLRNKKENKFFWLGKKHYPHVTTRQRQRLSIGLKVDSKILDVWWRHKWLKRWGIVLCSKCDFIFCLQSPVHLRVR